eukprot:scaffold129586_cov63-Phaeocystis_antarctica.AAC.1
MIAELCHGSLRRRRCMRRQRGAASSDRTACSVGVYSVKSVGVYSGRDKTLALAPDLALCACSSCRSASVKSRAPSAATAESAASSAASSDFV